MPLADKRAVDLLQFPPQMMCVCVCVCVYLSICLSVSNSQFTVYFFIEYFPDNCVASLDENKPTICVWSILHYMITHHKENK